MPPRDITSPQLYELTASVKAAANHYMVWNSLTWQGLSNMAYDLDRKVSDNFTTSEPCSASLPPSVISDYEWNDKDGSSLSLRSTTSAGSQEAPELPYFPQTKVKDASDDSDSPSSSSTDDHTEESGCDFSLERRRRDVWAPTDVDCLVAGWNLRRKFLFWSAWCFRQSRHAISRCLRREGLMWVGRFHPLVSLLNPETGRMYVEARLQTTEQRGAYTQQLNDAVDDLIVKSKTVERRVDPSTMEVTWEPIPPTARGWNWWEILKIATTVVVTSLPDLSESKSAYAFALAMQR